MKTAAKKGGPVAERVSKGIGLRTRAVNTRTARNQNRQPDARYRLPRFIGNFWFGPALSGVLTFLADCQIHFCLAWICFVPFFVSVLRSSPKAAFKKGLVFGAAVGVPTFFWMVQSAVRFTGGNAIYGIAALLLSTALFSLYYGAATWFFIRFTMSERKRGSLLMDTLFTAAAVCLAERPLRLLAVPFPWFGVYAGSGLADSLYGIQPVALFGPAVLSFTAIAANHLMAHFIATKAYKKLYVPAAVFAAYMLTGFVLFNVLKLRPSGKAFRVAAIAPNLPPETVWDSANGNGLAQRLFALNRSALSFKPNVILWPETAVPWTYDKNDDLLKEVLRITAPAKAVHILGISTAHGQNQIFNSAYSLLPDGSVAGRYDKQYLLSLIEKPLNGWMLPFFSGAGVSMLSGKELTAPLATPYGKAGILLCNESTLPEAAASQAKGGAQLLFNMSNDGWFSDSYLARIHFFNARLRAVETRKDLVIASNTGYSGFIAASGSVEQMEKSEDPFVLSATVQPNDQITPAVVYPHLFVYGCGLCVLLMVVLWLYKRASPATGNQAATQCPPLFK